MKRSSNIDLCLDALERLFRARNGWVRRSEVHCHEVTQFTASTVWDALAIMEGFGLRCEHIVPGKTYPGDWYVWLAPFGVECRRGNSRRAA